MAFRWSTDVQKGDTRDARSCACVTRNFKRVRSPPDWRVYFSPSRFLKHDDKDRKLRVDSRTSILDSCETITSVTLRSLSQPPSIRERWNPSFLPHYGEFMWSRRHHFRYPDTFRAEIQPDGEKKPYWRVHGCIGAAGVDGILFQPGAETFSAE